MAKKESVKREFTNFDSNKLRAIIKEKHTNASQLSEDIGRDRSYIHYCLTSDKMPTNVFNLILRILDVKAEDLMPDVKTPVESPEIAVKSGDNAPTPAPQIDFNMIATVVTAAMKTTNDMLLALSKDVMDLRRDISGLKRITEDGIVWQETMAESLEKVSQGINAVKLQNARIKDAVGVGEGQSNGKEVK